MGDPPRGSPIIEYSLIDDAGRWTTLLLEETLLRSLGGASALDRKRVRATGALVPPGTLRVRSIDLESAPGAGAPLFGVAPLAGPQRWVTILCRFGDATSVTPHPKTWFETLMGTSSPGMDHCWREVSYEIINLTGSVVVGWYDLPQPRSYYVYDGDGDGDDDLDHSRAVRDSTGVADADVFFPDFMGINLMFNQTLGCCAWGGGATMNRDGITRSYRFTWMPPWGYENQDVMGHQMGHGFGLPHSSGPYDQTYDSNWDVMSGGGLCAARHPEYGCVAVHTISYHKDRLEWVPASRKLARCGRHLGSR